jgi:hypothetical protein
MSRLKRHHEDQIDPRLYEKLDLLRTTSPRNPEAAARGRAKFLTELETLELASPERARKGILPDWMTNRAKTRVAYAGSRKARFSFSGAILLITLLVFLFGGAGMTAYAAQSALPGDILYPVKTSMEQAQLVLSTNPAERAQLEMKFAERRLVEIAGLVEEGQFQEISTTADQFEAHIRNVMADLEYITSRDPGRAAGLSTQISDGLARYAYTLSSMLEQVPEAVQVKMMHTIQNTWLTGNIGEIVFNGGIDSMGSQAWVIAGQAVAIREETEVKGSFAIGDVVKVRAVRNEDGSLSARQIERVLAGMEDVSGNKPGENGADDPNIFMGGSDKGENGKNSGSNQDQNNTPGDPEGDFQNQTQDPNYPGSGSGKEGYRYQPPTTEPGPGG